MVYGTGGVRERGDGDAALGRKVYLRGSHDYLHEDDTEFLPYSADWQPA